MVFLLGLLVFYRELLTVSEITLYIQLIYNKKTGVPAGFFHARTLFPYFETD